MLEKELEAKFRESVREAGGRAYKFVSPGNSGVPDRLVVLPGGHIGFVELKQPGKKPTRLQARQHNILRGLGCYVAVLDRPENTGKVLDGIREAGVRDAI